MDLQLIFRGLLLLSLAGVGCRSTPSHRWSAATQEATNRVVEFPTPDDVFLASKKSVPSTDGTTAPPVPVKKENETADHASAEAAMNLVSFEKDATKPVNADRTAVRPAVVQLETEGARPQLSAEPTPSVAPDPSQSVDGADEHYVIDLPTVLRLAGTDNWGVRLAYERICEAQARLDAAEVMWLPSLNLGVGYTKHDGRIQATTGEVLDVSRNSFFVGGGAVTADAPTTGGAGGPARLFVDLSLADAIFQPLAARQNVNAVRSAHAKTFNDSQLAASTSYYDLLGAQGMLAIDVENLADAQRLEEMTEAFVAAGKASEAEVMRVQVVTANRRQNVIDAELAIQLASAELARQIQLDPAEFGIGTRLQSVETHIVPIELTPSDVPLDGLIAQGRGVRAEVAEEYSRVQSEYERVRQEKWRPWIPNLHFGVSAGAFGGGVGGDLDGLDGRGDLDAILVWQVRNLGFGAEAAQREQGSRYRQAVLRSHQMQDVIAAEVKQAWSEVEAARQQIELTRETLAVATEVYDRNITRIRSLEGLPLEAIQALDAVASVRRDHLAAVIRFNQAQLKLLRAIGQPLESF